MTSFFHQRQSSKNFFATPWFLLLSGGICLVLGTAVVRAYYHEYQIRQEINRLKGEAEQLEAKKIETIETLRYVQSQAFVEEKARTELNLKKEGENVIIISTTTPSQSHSRDRQSEEKMVKLIQPNISKWWRYFFRK